MKVTVERSSQCLILLAILLATCFVCRAQRSATVHPQALTLVRSSEVDSGVRAFMRDVAHDVTQDGPAAWRKYFADTPSFFMVVNGQMAFANSAAATTGIQQVALAIKKIELKWDDDLRVDPLAPDLAVVAVPWHEVQVDAAGHRVEGSGYFTGVAQYRDGRWQFRDAHWSEPVPPPPAP